MNIKLFPTSSRKAATRAFSLVEAVVGLAILGITFTALYAGISSGFAVTQVARENLRATQIMLEKMECIRLYNWNQLNYSNMLPKSFVGYYYPLATNGESKGIAYYGTFTITNASVYSGASYESSMRKVIVSISWTNGGVARSRNMSTMVSKRGIQNYVFDI